MIEIEFLAMQRNQPEASPLKNLFFLAALKLDMKDSFGYSKEIWKDVKNLSYNINLLYVNIAQNVLY